MKYTSKTGTVWDTNLMGLLIDKCDNCNKTGIGKKLMDKDMLCDHCYYDEKTMECEECGKEISAFDYNDFNGMCAWCADGYQLITCQLCGEPIPVEKKEHACRICRKCEQVKKDAANNSVDEVCKCSNCSAVISYDVSNDTMKKYGDGLCKHCYYMSEIYECDSCGREITKFEVDYNSGECYQCNPEELG